MARKKKKEIEQVENESINDDFLPPDFEIEQNESSSEIKENSDIEKHPKFDKYK